MGPAEEADVVQLAERYRRGVESAAKNGPAGEEEVSGADGLERLAAA
jgi:hypothetical protein